MTWAVVEHQKVYPPIQAKQNLRELALVSQELLRISSVLGWASCSRCIFAGSWPKFTAVCSIQATKQSSWLVISALCDSLVSFVDFIWGRKLNGGLDFVPECFQRDVLYKWQFAPAFKTSSHLLNQCLSGHPSQQYTLFYLQIRSSLICASLISWRLECKSGSDERLGSWCD